MAALNAANGLSCKMGASRHIHRVINVGVSGADPATPKPVNDHNDSECRKFDVVARR